MAKGRELGGGGRLGPEGGKLTWLQDSLDMISLMATVAVPGLPQGFLFPAPSLIFIWGTVGLKKEKKDPNFQMLVSQGTFARARAGAP